MTLALVAGESRFADIANNFILTADRKNVFKYLLAAMKRPLASEQARLAWREIMAASLCFQ
jgi:hypothetical protein